MHTNHKSKYDSPTVTVVELKMEASLLTGSDAQGNRNPYTDGGNQTWY